MHTAPATYPYSTAQDMLLGAGLTEKQTVSVISRLSEDGVRVLAASASEPARQVVHALAHETIAGLAETLHMQADPDVAVVRELLRHAVGAW
ncbi:hypothetical protein ACWT_5850 [Actinoplanes sp. SE50]|uniref:hypothetical protein n=1 Tax=unclassified Actinoplanes TaxID=2626549 RepID=UPI00023EBDC6|nr:MULTISPECIES: hypothetical protein [unclassified Actinoplanes]AEV86868.1 hypothetical protein ACPL_5981 [Actinoplanes sp. SE50/110]ATO85265.1 hypothetical protein ACWT_5850 [Actinoplanes sp. SE50]SLM02675.1 hypothetical protein ACSP50_5957 [Actinoplanes sp. SE50/110]